MANYCNAPLKAEIDEKECLKLLFELLSKVQLQVNDVQINVNSYNSHATSFGYGALLMFVAIAGLFGFCLAKYSRECFQAHSMMSSYGWLPNVRWMRPSAPDPNTDQELRPLVEAELIPHAKTAPSSSYSLV